MQVARENLVVIITVGSIAGWLVGHFVKGIGFGILGDLVVGIAGGFTGDWLLPQLNIPLGPELTAAIFAGTRTTSPFSKGNVVRRISAASSSSLTRVMSICRRSTSASISPLAIASSCSDQMGGNQSSTCRTATSLCR